MTTIFMKMLSNDMWNYSTYIFQIPYYGCADEKEERVPVPLIVMKRKIWWIQFTGQV